MADSPILPTPIVKVFMDDGAVHEAQALNKDLLAFDRIRVRRKWPSATDAPLVWLTFIAYTVLTREQRIPAMTLDEFEDHALAVTAVDKDEDGGEPGADPTRTDREPA